MNQLQSLITSRFQPAQHVPIDTPLPGRTATPAELALFIAHLTTLVRDQSRAIIDDTPLYVSFGHGLRITDDLRLGDSTFAIAIERTRACNLASGRDIDAYLQARQPWETYDFYIVDMPSGDCTCVTHHDEVIAYRSQSSASSRAP